MKKILPLGIMTAVLFCTFPSALKAEDSNEQAVILFTNDVHASIQNYAELAAYRQELLNEGYDVLTIDAGDAIQGELIGLITEGRAVADLMNSVPYDIAVPGNHEFDFGMEAFLSIAQDKETYPSYEYICSNFFDTRSGNTVFEPYVIKELKGHQVGFVGIDTPETYTKSTPVYFQDEEGNYIYSFDENSLYETVQKAVDDARNQGAEYIIAVAHLGNEGVTDKWSSKELIANTNGIDALIDGHDHVHREISFTNNEGKEVISAETGYSFENIGKMTLSFSKNEMNISTEIMDVSVLKPDEDDNVRQAYERVQTKIDAYKEQTAYLEETIGKSEVELNTLDDADQWLARYEETALGNYTADAYKEVLGADIGFVNGGGIRGSGIKEGDISRKDMLDVNPWGNEMGVITVSGQEILDYLELTSASDWNAEAQHLNPNGAFIQTAGLTYEIHVNDDSSPVVKDDKGMFISFDGNKQRRVQNVKVNVEPIDPDGSYTIAGSIYVLRDSSEAVVFSSDAALDKSELTDGDILEKYLMEHLDQRITKEQYGRNQNRITISYEPLLNDVTSIAWFVIRGDYGNGVIRVQRLSEAGYDPIAVQNKVNELVYAGLV